MSYSGSTKNLCAYIAQSNLDTTPTITSAFTVNSIKVHQNGAHVFGNGTTLPTFNNEVRVVSAAVFGTGNFRDSENKGLYCSNTSGPARGCSQLNGNHAATSVIPEKLISSAYHNRMIGLPSVITGKVTPTSATLPAKLLNRSMFTLNFVLKD
jgi:hypothetical protein